MNELARLAEDLEHASRVGAAQAGAGAVQLGALQAETGLRTPGRAASFATTGLGSLQARIGATQPRGVYQSSAPAVAANISTDQIASTMARTAAALGARAVH